MATPTQTCLEAINLQHPDLVSALHAAYRSAGAEVLTTNTFGANRFRLAAHGRADQVHSINLAGARLAKSQARQALVAGSIGPTGLQPAPSDDRTLVETYRQQASALHEGGVDVFSCETFGDVAELRAAIQGIRLASPRPIWAQMTYRANGRTPLGLTPAQVVSALADLPVDAIGVNCAVGENTVERVIAALRRATDLPLIAQPNAGRPVKSNGSWIYPLTPDEFADTVTRLSEHCSMISGCCGTTPEHIAAAATRIGLSPPRSQVSPQTS
jgi:methionine synthase I (cobalamin-dependent)